MSETKFLSFLFWVIITTNSVAQRKFEGEYNFRNYSTENGLPSSETYDLEQDNEGNIWIATDRGVVKYNGRKFITFTKKDGLIDDVILQLYKDPFGRIWFISTTHELCYFENERIVPYKFNKIIKRYFKFFENPEKNILVLKNNTLVLSIATFGSITINNKGKLKELFQKKSTLKIWSIGGNKVWSLKGVGKYVPNLKYQIFSPSKNDSREILIGEDTAKEVRIRYTGNNKNAFVLMNNHLYDLITRKKIIQARNHTAINLECIDNKLFIGYISKGVKIYDLNSYHPLYIKTILTNYSISNVLKDKKGGYWFSTLESGLFYLANFEINGYKMRNGLLSDDVKSVFGLNNNIFIGYQLFD